MHEVWAVIRREYLARVRSKWFLLGTLGAPVLLIGAASLTAVMSSQGSQDDRVAVLDETRQLGQAVVEALDDLGYRAELAEGQARDPGALNLRVLDGEIGGYFILDDRTMERGHVVFRGEEGPSTLRRVAVQGAITRIVAEARFGDAAEDASSLFRGGSLDVELMGAEDASEDEKIGLLYAVIGSTLLYIALLVYGISLLRAVIEEKTNRTVEVMLSAIRPGQMMLGKILGVGGVAFTQIAAWAGIFALAAAFGIPALIASQPDFSELGALTDVAPGIRVLGLFVVFFVLSFLLFASLYAAAGAMCSTEQEAQQLAQPVSFLIIAPFVILMITLERGLEVGWVKALSFVPFFSPILMFARAASGTAPAWQIAVALLLMAATIVAVAWLAGRIYRVGILMQGKRPTLPELMRWVREG